MQVQLLRRLKVLEQRRATTATERIKPLPAWYVEAWLQAGGRFDESGKAGWSDVGRIQGQQELADDRPSADVAKGPDTKSESSSWSPVAVRSSLPGSRE